MTSDLAHSPWNRRVKRWQRSVGSAMLGLLGLLIGFPVAASPPAPGAASTAPAATAPATSTYQLVLEALESGKTVRLVSDLGHCVTRTGQAGPPIQAGLQISAFIATPDKGMFFSDVHPTLDATDHPITEYVRYNLAIDGDLIITTARRSSGTVTKQDPLVCKVPTGAKFIW
jgi:hypothetical protein